jgi:hypothetical protein
MLKPVSFLLVALLCLASGATARAHDAHDSDQVVHSGTTQIVNNVHPELHIADARQTEPPSALLHGLQGFLAGALVGTGIGYLTIGESAHEPWRDVLLGAGVGGLSGAGLGLGVGLLDASMGKRSAARYVMRDMLYGTGLGALFGSVVGGLVALDSDDAEDVLVGGSIGAISGALLGVVTGVVEGQWRKPHGHDAAKTRISAVLGLSRDRAGQHLLLPGVAGRF